MEKKTVYLVAAGTGGHINAAKSLGNYYRSKNFEVLYITGQRELDRRLFQGESVYHLKSESIRNRSIFKKVLSVANNLVVFYQTLSLMTVKRPVLVIGAGGYICGPVLMAAFFLGIPFSILEQNSVVGLTNKILSYFANRVFVNFRHTYMPYPIKHKLIVSGNPVRKEFRELVPQPRENFLKLLVVGGSLGALEINDLIKNFIESKVYSESNLWIRHQTGLGKGFSLNQSEIKYEQFEYIDNMAQEYKWADIILCRSGASTLSELRYLQKSTVLVPYPYATDNHQEINAQSFRQEANFPVFVHKTKELSHDRFSLLLQILERSRNVAIHRINYEGEKTTEDLIYKECLNDL